MKFIAQKFSLLLLALVATTAVFAQRKISGVVYLEGKPAAGINIEAHKSSDSFYTSFDGKYELEINDKTKYIKFTWLEESKKLEIEGNTASVFNFSFDGADIPEGSEEGGVILKSHNELYKSGDQEYLTNYTLYEQYYKQKDYRSALTNWKFIYNTYPKASKKTYRVGQIMYMSFISEATSAEEKLAYLDTIVQINDKRIDFLDAPEDKLLSRKAATYLSTLLEIDKEVSLDNDVLVARIQKGYEFSEAAMAAEGNATEPSVITYYMLSTKRLFTAGVATKTQVLENYERVSGILDTQIASEDDVVRQKAEQSKKLVDGVFETSGAADCTALTELYHAKFPSIKDDAEKLNKMIRMLNRKGCTDTDFYEMASEQSYTLDPNAESAVAMARTFVRKDILVKAKEYYTKAIELESDASIKASYYYELASIVYSKGDYLEARRLARESVKADKSYCKSYILIGNIYASKAKEFSNNEFQQKTVYWLAVDYFNKAAAYSDCASDAKKSASLYSRYFPNNETVFMEGLTVGAQYRIEGWINETTTIRESK